MARNGNKGFTRKIFGGLQIVMLLFCTIYIVIDIVGKSGQSDKLELMGDAVEQSKKEITKAVDKLNKNNKSIESDINLLKRQNKTLVNEVRQMSFKVKDSGVKWITNPANGHQYCLTPSLPWHQAKKWAAQQGGSLVVINSKEENDWLVKAFGGESEYWIGLTDEASEGQWFWVIGSPAQYLNWLKGEPDNYRNQQHYGIINCKSPGMWNDAEANDSRIAIVEKKRP